MSDEDHLDPPTEGAADRMLAIAKAVVSDLVPMGGTLAELAGQFVRTPYQRRLAEWQTQLGETLHRLEGELKRIGDAQVLTLRDLQSDPLFLDTILHASRVALHTSSTDKHAALRNAILNAGLPLAPDESLRQMFLDMIESFTPWHLRVLSLVDCPPDWFVVRGRAIPAFGFSSSLAQLLEVAYPELVGQRDFYDQVWAGLRFAGLVHTDSLHGMMSPQGVFAPRTSGMGRKFVAFISEPSQKEPAGNS